MKKLLIFPLLSIIMLSCSDDIESGSSISIKVQPLEKNEIVDNSGNLTGLLTHYEAVNVSNSVAKNVHFEVHSLDKKGEQRTETIRFGNLKPKEVVHFEAARGIDEEDLGTTTYYSR